MNRVLLTDAQQRKTLAAVRSLGKKGLQVHVTEETRFATARFSRYCSGGLVSPNPGRKPEEFYLWLKEKLGKNRYDLLYPMDDGVMEVVMRHREEFEKLCRIPIPDLDSYLVASDKARSTMAAMEAGLECPWTVMVRDIGELSRLAQDLSFPLVIKPRKNSGSRGIVVVWRKEDLVGLYLNVHKNFPFPILQEYISPGEKYDVCLLYNRSSQVKASFVQKEIRFFPLERGPSTVQESVWRPDLVEKAIKLMKKLNWYGVAEVEFMVDSRDGRVRFMEINPRFWGSLQMSILAGVDFPWLLYRLAVEGDIEEVTDYTTGIKCRWLLPGDILNFLYNRDRFKSDPPFFSTSKSGIHDDIISIDDPFPVVGFFLACLRYIPDRNMWKFFFPR